MTTLTQVTPAELQEWFGDLLEPLFGSPRCHGLVIYTCLDLWSSQHGARKALAFGEGFTCATAADCLQTFPRLDTELASTQKWPTHAWYRDLMTVAPAPAAPSA